MEIKKGMWYNYLGEEITEPFQQRNPNYFDNTGKPLWEQLQHSDSDGFDVREDICEIILPVGTRLVRYGRPAGYYTAPAGTEYEALSLPYLKESLPYHEYVVKDTCNVLLCIVTKGIVAPGFDNPGGGVQFKHRYTIQQEIKRGVLEEDFSWLIKQRQ